MTNSLASKNPGIGSAHYQIDLHAHTTASDGACSPVQLVERAVERGIRVLGIADHDTIDGIIEAQAAGHRLGLEIVSAIEFSIRHEPEKHFVGIHLLGYFIDVQAPALVKIMAKVKQGRIDQKVRQIEKLQSFGFDVPVDAVFARAGGVPGRPHIAAVLLERNRDKFNTIQEIFDEYLGVNAKAYVKRQFALTVGQAAVVIKEAGGLPVLAHPGAYAGDIDPIIAVRNAKIDGVEGVEVFYPYSSGHRPAYNLYGQADNWINCIDKLADDLNLLKSGGTDYHGRPHDSIELGDMGLTDRQFAALKAGWQKLRGAAQTGL